MDSSCVWLVIQREAISTVIHTKVFAWTIHERIAGNAPCWIFLAQFDEKLQEAKGMLSRSVRIMGCRVIDTSHRGLFVRSSMLIIVLLFGHFVHCMPKVTISSGPNSWLIKRRTWITASSVTYGWIEHRNMPKKIACFCFQRAHLDISYHACQKQVVVKVT